MNNKYFSGYFYPAYDAIEDREYSPAERLAPQRVAIERAKRLLDQAEHTLAGASPALTDDALCVIAEATEQAVRAVENLTFLGLSEYAALPVHTVGWNAPNAVQREAHTKTVTISTHDLQKTVIALICYHEKDDVVTEEDRQRLIDFFSDLNALCYAGNDYTLTLDVQH